MPRETTQFPKGHRQKSPGRPKGSENETKKEARVICRKLVEDKEYQKNLLSRMRKGEAGAIENTVWYYAYGKPQSDTNVKFDLSLLTDKEVAALAVLAPKISVS